MQSGTVKWFSDEKGFGVVALEDGSGEVFVHYSAIAGQGRKSLTEGEHVELDATRGPKGLRATLVLRDLRRE